jgi:hypothetical protein
MRWSGLSASFIFRYRDVPAAVGDERRAKTTLFGLRHGASGRMPESPFHN